MGSIANLARSVVNDTFTGVNGQQGRIFTNDAPFMLPYFNSAFRTLQRKLRNEGVTFPIKDNVILTNMTPVVEVNNAVQVYVGYDGYFDGTTMHATPKLPSDLLQPYLVQEQTIGSGFPFTPMAQPEEGLPSAIQGPMLKMWEWRNYKIYMIGSTQAKNLRLRYQSGQPPLDVPAADFDTTAVGIIDCEDAMAFLMVGLYGASRGANPQVLLGLEQKADAAISDMALEYVRRSQTVTYRRTAYGEGGSNDGGNTNLGQAGQG